MKDLIQVTSARVVKSFHNGANMLDEARGYNLLHLGICEASELEKEIVHNHYGQFGYLQFALRLIIETNQISIEPIRAYSIIIEGPSS